MDCPLNLIIPSTVIEKTTQKRVYGYVLSVTQCYLVSGNQEEQSERMNEVGESSDDRISQLPENVIHHILMLLPIKDAARTAFMSTKWRCHWRSIPRVVFDDGFAQITEPSMINKLILNIYKSLLVHDGPIPKFVLAIPGLTTCDELDHIILNLSGRGVQEFTLVLSSTGEGHIYKLPSYLFTALQLNHLKLEYCSFMAPPWFVGFSKLTYLELNRVIVPSDFLENFLQKCPLLEDLRLVHCTGPTKLELDAPHLKLFIFAALFSQKICFKRTPRLSALLLNVDVFQKPDLVALFASLPALQQLYLPSDFLGVGAHVPSRLPSPLRRLQQLHVYRRVFDSIEMERVLVCLIMSSPNLQTLTMQRYTSKLNQPAGNLVTAIGSLLEAEHRCGSGCCLQHFRVFEIENSLATQLELELVKFILATAPQLSKIRIKPQQQLGSRKVTKFMKEVMQYKRLSKEAEVIYKWSDGHADLHTYVM